MLESLTIFIASIGIVFLIQVPRRLSPSHYFAFNEIIHGMNNAVTWQALAIRFSIPFLVALTAALIIADNQIFVGLGTGLLSSLLLVWPVLLDRRSLPPQAIGRDTELWLVYAMFVASFVVLGLSAGFLADFLEEPLERLLSGQGARKVWAVARDDIHAVVLSAIGSLVAACILAVAMRRQARLQRESDDEEQ